MACTDTGLKMCILPAVLTLKPLMERGKNQVKNCFSLHPSILSTNSYCTGALTGQKNQDENFSH